MRASILNGLCLLFGAFLAASVTLAEPSYSHDIIYSGHKVGIKYPHRVNSWLGCWNGYCNRATCPGLFFQGQKAHCFGEIFRIYKRRGNGAIRAGDVVGLYYPHTKQWLSCWDSRCDRRSCPGAPSTQYGMNTINRCAGEVFRVYAMGKNVGDYLEDKDVVMFYYAYQNNHWLGLAHDRENRAGKATCPGSGYHRPADSLYERCWGETFEINRLKW